ncbi:MAG: hypothetical protein NXH91_18555 [Phyllobacteriaceae bacterium]|nr:hypothetical protein [Phyllobacteriaceae bacterium]
MNEHEYTYSLIILWVAFPLGAWLGRRFDSDWRFYPVSLAPLAVALIGHYSGLFDFAPLNRPLPDLGNMGNSVVYVGVAVGLSVWLGMRVRDSRQRDEQ